MQVGEHPRQDTPRRWNAFTPYRANTLSYEYPTAHVAEKEIRRLLSGLLAGEELDRAVQFAVVNLNSLDYSNVYFGYQDAMTRAKSGLFKDDFDEANPHSTSAHDDRIGMADASGTHLATDSIDWSRPQQAWDSWSRQYGSRTITGTNLSSRDVFDAYLNARKIWPDKKDEGNRIVYTAAVVAAKQPDTVAVIRMANGKEMIVQVQPRDVEAIMTMSPSQIAKKEWLARIAKIQKDLKVQDKRGDALRELAGYMYDQAQHRSGVEAPRPNDPGYAEYCKGKTAYQTEVVRTDAQLRDKVFKAAPEPQPNPKAKPQQETETKPTLQLAP